MKTKLLRKIFTRTAALALCSVTVLSFAACKKEKKTENPQAAIDPNATSVSYYAYDLSGITLGTYKGVEIKKDLTVKDIEVREYYYDDLKSVSKLNETNDDGEITAESDFYKKYLALQIKSGVNVKEGDLVNIDYEGYLGDTKFDGGTAAAYDLLIGSDAFIDGFEDSIIGHEAGTDFDINVTFPENYGSADLAGKAVVFKIKLNYIYPEMTEETVDIIEEVYKAANTTEKAAEETAAESTPTATEAPAYKPPFSTVDEYKAYVQATLKESKDKEFEENKANEVLMIIRNNSKFESYPEDVLQVFENALNAQAAAYGIDLKTYLSYFYGISTDEQIEQYKKLQVGYECVIAGIIKAEGLKITEEEFNAGVTKYTKEYGYESEEVLLEQVPKEDIENKLLSDKVLKLIVDEAKIVVVK